MKEKSEKLALLGFEFWNNIGEAEIKLIVGKDKKDNYNFIFNNHMSLIEIILVNIGKVNEDDDLEEWNLSRASSYLLRLIVQLTGVDVIDKLMLIIQGNLVLVY
jgi:hypothetical protein